MFKPKEKSRKMSGNPSEIFQTRVFFFVGMLVTSLKSVKKTKKIHASTITPTTIPTPCRTTTTTTPTLPPLY
jgi:hypothetical protein